MTTHTAEYMREYRKLRGARPGASGRKPRLVPNKTKGNYILDAPNQERNEKCGS